MIFLSQCDAILFLKYFKEVVESSEKVMYPVLFFMSLKEYYFTFLSLLNMIYMVLHYCLKFNESCRIAKQKRMFRACFFKNLFDKYKNI